MGRKTTSKLEILKDGQHISDPKLLADLFSTTFKEKIDANLNKLGGRKTTDYSKKINELSNFTNDVINFTEEQVRKVILNMSTKKSTGHDQIPAVAYKDSLKFTLPHLTKLFNMVEANGCIPDNWRIAKIIPVHKKGPKNQASNYRPVSNLCTISKIYERLILAYIYELEEKTKILLTGRHQHGFVKKPQHNKGRTSHPRKDRKDHIKE